ncbi:hypothetical protein [Ammoniphilus sp. 3BR4]|uniref:hypothetical protein n=1 Tax=Ammoniphilus sp. 3BR4 TaxID=3158265 RepID=UPI003467818C
MVPALDFNLIGLNKVLFHTKQGTVMMNCSEFNGFSLLNIIARLLRNEKTAAV